MMTHMRMETSPMLTHLSLLRTGPAKPAPAQREYQLRTPDGRVLDTRTMPGAEAADRNAVADDVQPSDGARRVLASMEYPRPSHLAGSACRFEIVGEIAGRGGEDEGDAAPLLEASS